MHPLFPHDLLSPYLVGLCTTTLFFAQEVTISRANDHYAVDKLMVRLIYLRVSGGSGVAVN